VTKTPLKDVSASVRARLLRLARERGEDFQLVLTRYANERLLSRLAASRHAQRFVLKGAALFTLWTGKPHRATRDLDLLGFGDPGEAHMREVFAEVLVLDVADDGVHFDLESLAVGLIREEQEYGGVGVEVASATPAASRRQSQQ
jgi:predicted nucleotidyltransferase component of viral defense system